MFKQKRMLSVFGADIRRFWRERRSDTAVEFALIGGAFFFFIFGIFVFSINQFMQLTLDEAVRSAARQVQANLASSSGQFVGDVCGEFGPVANGCAAALQYDVQLGPYFGTGLKAPIIPAVLGQDGLSVTSAFPAATNGYLPGSSETTVADPEFLLVQVAYPALFHVILPLGGLIGTENGTPYLYSAVAVDMEPGP